MAAYALAESLEVTDPNTMAEYGKLARESIAQYDGKVLAAGPDRDHRGRLDAEPAGADRVSRAWKSSRLGTTHRSIRAALPLRLRSARDNFRLPQRALDWRRETDLSLVKGAAVPVLTVIGAMVFMWQFSHSAEHDWRAVYKNQFGEPCCDGLRLQRDSKRMWRCGCGSAISPWSAS